jgi:hypothetical protein
LSSSCISSCFGICEHGIHLFSTSHLLESSRNIFHFTSNLKVSSTRSQSDTFQQNSINDVKNHGNFPFVSFKHTNSLLYNHRNDSHFIILLPKVNLQPCEIL